MENKNDSTGGSGEYVDYVNQPPFNARNPTQISDIDKIT